MSPEIPGLPPNVVSGHRSQFRALAGIVFERHGIALKEDDPAFALVTMNELVLRKLTGKLLKNVDHHMMARLSEFEKTMQRVEQRASEALAKQVRESARGLVGMLREDIAVIRSDIPRMIGEIRDSRRITCRARWVLVTAIATVAVFGCGFWVGRN